MDDSKEAADGGNQAAQPAATDDDACAGGEVLRPHGVKARDFNAPDAEEANSGGEEAVDDEQVELFFALLANIRAMRRLYMPANSDDTTTASGAGGKRSWSAAAGPWRPAFRLEDFDGDDGTSRCVRMKEGGSQKQQPDIDQGGAGGRPVVVVAPPPSLSSSAAPLAARAPAHGYSGSNTI